MPRAPSACIQPVVLTIAGSDSGGGAGIQADLKTFAALRCFGTTALTCVTAQNPSGVTAVGALAPALVAQQIRAVCAGFPVAAAKTGMLYSAAIIRTVAREVAAARFPCLVVDPVMVATSGARLLREDAVTALGRELLPLATVVTPNAPEAEVLAGFPVTTRAALRRAARAIGRRFGVACLVKGGHLARGAVVDVLYDAGTLYEFVTPRVAARETHGTGCTLSAALTACLARGCSVPEAAARAQAFVVRALANPVQAGSHFPLGIR